MKPIPDSIKALSQEPEIDPAVVDSTGIPPMWAHQRETYEFSLERPGVLDYSDPGTGKTRAHLEEFNTLLRSGEVTSLLVLCPKTLIESAWGDDIEEYLPDLDYSMAYARNREEAFNKDCPIFITNIDAVKWLAAQKRKFFERFGPRPMWIVDESTAFKHVTGGPKHRSKAAQNIRGFFPWRRMMSGTPNPNSVLELWNQAYLVDDGERLGTRYYKFRSVVCEPQQNGPRPEHVKWVDKPQIEPVVSHLLRDITIRHDFDDCMDIPENHKVIRRFTPNDKLMKYYREMEERCLLELEKGDVMAVNQGVLANKLLQVASGAVYHADGSYSVLDTQRYELVADLVEARRHSVVFFNWTHQKEQTCKLLDKRGINYAIVDSGVPDAGRARIRREYQQGAYQCILLHPKTGAHGLTLTRGESVIFSSPLHEADLLYQGWRRIARGGQTKVTSTEMVCARGTRDEMVYANTDDKGNRMRSFADLMKTPLR